MSVEKYEVNIAACHHLSLVGEEVNCRILHSTRVIYVSVHLPLCKFYCVHASLFTLYTLVTVLPNVNKALTRKPINLWKTWRENRFPLLLTINNTLKLPPKPIPQVASFRYNTKQIQSINFDMY